MQLRGEMCIGSASVLSLAALLCLIFMHIGQINTSPVPRDISMVKVNMSGYGAALHTALSDPIEGLYTTNASAPLQKQAGLRNFYYFGLYSYCAYPFQVITADMLANYSDLTDYIISPTTFTDSSYLGQFSNGAYYLLLIGTICAAIALLSGIIKHPLTFLSSTVFAIIGSAMLLIGATIWTVIVHKAQSINNVQVGTTSDPSPLEIIVSMGDGIYLAWAAFALLVASIMPYMISCCTFRG